LSARGPRAAAAALLALVLVKALPAAAEGEPTAADRAEWLRRELYARNRDLLARDPQAVAEKLARMAHHLFGFFRGTAGLLHAEPSRFVPPGAAHVAVVGDPHPENIGTFRTSAGARVLELNDFDLAGYGSYVEDLRRLALGLWVVADMADVSKRQRARVVESLLQGYVDEIQRLARGEPPTSIRADAVFGGALDEILADADDEARALGRGVPATAAERALVVAALERYPATLVTPARWPKAAFACKRVVRLNAGISSYPVLRLRAVVEGPSAAADDDWILELKEVRAGKAAPLVQIERQFHEAPDEDPLLGWASVEGRELRVRQVSAEERRLSAARLAKAIKSPRFGKKDLRALGAGFGHLLARGHARARGSDGQPGLHAIAAAIGDGRGLTEETVAVTGRAAALVDGDFKLFRALLERHGRLLGWK